MAGYQVNPAGIGVGKRYGNLQVGTTDGVLTDSDDGLVAVIKLNCKDVTGPHTISIPPNCKVIGIRESCKAAWSASKKALIKLNGNAIDDATNNTPLGTTAGVISDVTLNATAANLQTGATAKNLTVTPPTDVQGSSVIFVTFVRM